MCRPLDQVPRGQVPAGFAMRASLAVTAGMVDVIALAQLRSAFNHQILAVVLPVTCFEV